MRGADTFTEGLFTLKKLDDFVPANHPLRVIRTMVNKALAEMGELFAGMYEEDAKGGRPSIAPEKLLRAMLLQVLYSIRSERIVDSNDAAVSLSVWRNYFSGISYDEKFELPMIKQEGKWLVDVRGINREMFPALPR